MAPKKSEPKKSKASSSKQNTSTYPTQWSQWDWIADSGRWARYRKFGPGADDYEYEYESPHENTGATTSQPVTDSGNAGSSRQEIGQNWNAEHGQGRGRSGSTSQENYGDRNIDATLATQLSRVNISSNDPVRSQGGGYSQGYPRSTSTAAISSQQIVPVPREPPRWVHTKDRRTKVDALDENFKVHRTKEFKFGRVFKVLWAEPKGGHGTEITVKNANAKFGEQAFQKIRRFLVVKNDVGHCICLSILTYGGQGTLKHGVHSSHHAAIYSSNYEKEYVLEGEHMLKQPIMMHPDPEYETLDPMSRINYAKIYTVEHNVKVFFIGRIAEEHLGRVVADYNSTHLPLPDVPPATSSRDDLRATEGPDPAYVATSSRLSPANISWATGAGRGTTSGYSPQPPRRESRGSFSYPVESGSGTGGSYPLRLIPSREGDQLPGYGDAQREHANPAFSSNGATSTLSAPVVSSAYGHLPHEPQQSSDAPETFDSSLYEAD